MNHHEVPQPVEQTTLADAIGGFFEVFDDHFKDDPDYNPALPLDENIDGYARTVSWSETVEGMPVEFKCRRVVYGSSEQWITYEDGVRQLAPHKPFDPVQCASAMKRAIANMKRDQQEGA